MTTINKLSATDTVTDGDLVPVFVQSAGDARKAPMSVLKAYMQAALAFSAGKAGTVYASPLTGATVTLTGTDDAWLVLTPAGTIATLTIALPSAPVDRQEVGVSAARTVTALTLSGATVIGAPTTTGAALPFRLRYEGVAGAWYRVS